jgi:hypothetical protein
MTLSESLNAQAERETSGIICRGCNETKQPGKPFCLECYRRLPPHLQRDLRDASSKVYGPTYDEAKSWLREND